MSLTTNQIKLIQSLKLKKNRILHRLFVAEGEKVVSELLGASLRIRAIYCTDPSRYALREEIVTVVSEKELSRISSLTTPNNALALVEIPTTDFDKNIAFSEWVIVLDQINDPGNLGTIMRIADWFGINHIVCSNGSVDAYNSKTVQSSMGSIARVCCTYTNLESLFQSYTKGKSPAIYGTILDGKPLYSLSKATSGFILFGSESHGISPGLMPYVSEKITIPRYGKAESLNVAVAAAIVCAEFRR